MNKLLFISGLLLAACSGKAPQESLDNQSVEIDSAREFYDTPEEKVVYTYTQFAGIYDHESNTQGFSAVLNVTESGNDLSFTLSVSQGSCKGEVEGKIIMLSHEENYYTGFYEQTKCPLQFMLTLRDNKIDIKEINLCQLHESSCTFEGVYSKRKAT